MSTAVLDRPATLSLAAILAIALTSLATPNLAEAARAATSAAGQRQALKEKARTTLAASKGNRVRPGLRFARRFGLGLIVTTHPGVRAAASSVGGTAVHVGSIVGNGIAGGTKFAVVEGGKAVGGSVVHTAANLGGLGMTVLEALPLWAAYEAGNAVVSEFRFRAQRSQGGEKTRGEVYGKYSGVAKIARTVKKIRANRQAKKASQAEPAPEAAKPAPAASESFFNAPEVETAAAKEAPTLTLTVSRRAGSEPGAKVSGVY